MGLELEADPRHDEIIIGELGHGDAKPMVTPGTKDGTDGKEEPLSTGKPLKYKANNV